MRIAVRALAVAALVGAPAAAGLAQDWDHIANETREATNVLEEFMAVPEKSIPPSFLNHAVCLAVVPKVIKAGLGIGGRRGTGLMTCRGDSDWSAPVFVKLTGGSIGLQIGVQSTDVVFVFVNRDAARRILDDQFTFGGQASVAAGPLGRTAEAASDVTFESEIYSYSRSKGLFAGLTFEGAKFGVDQDWVRDVYGDVTASDLLFGSGAQTPEILQPFVATVRKHAPMSAEAVDSDGR